MNPTPLSKESKTTVLMGDSTMDNSEWVKKGESVCDRLRASFSRDHRIIDLSNDGFTLDNVLHGAKANKVFPFNPSKRHPRETFYPITELMKIETVDHLVLSVGGNDVREQLPKLLSAPGDKSEAFLDEITQKIHRNYIQILEILAGRNIKPIIMLQYLPDSTHDQYHIYELMQKLTSDQNLESAIQYLQHLMQRVYQPILQYAQEHGLPIIDLASSLNYRDSSLYVSQIEPSAKGGEQIARLIKHVIDIHPCEGPSLLYATPDISGEIIAVTTDAKSWRPHFQRPESGKDAIAMFTRVYEKQIEAERARFLGFGKFLSRQKSLENLPAALNDIVKHATSGGERSREVMQLLGWMSQDNELTRRYIDEVAVLEGPKI